MTHDASEITIYLLHLDPPVGRAAHYLGSCYSERLPERMKEHAHGRGAALTAAAVKGGSRFILAATWTTDDRSLEQRMKQAGHLKKKCPICRLGGEQLALPIFDPQPAAVASTGKTALSW